MMSLFDAKETAKLFSVWETGVPRRTQRSSGGTPKHAWHFAVQVPGKRPASIVVSANTRGEARAFARKQLGLAALPKDVVIVKQAQAKEAS